MLIQGDAAPEVTGNDIRNNAITFTLSDHPDKVIFLAFVAYQTPACTELLGRMEFLWQEFQGHGVEVVAVNVDPWVQNAIDWLNGPDFSTHLITFPVLQDNITCDTFQSYSTTTGPIFPQFYIITRDQVIHWSDIYIGHSYEVLYKWLRRAIFTLEPVDFELILDMSGSMNNSPSGTSDTKLDLMKTVSSSIINILGYLLEPMSNYRMGLVYFSDDANEYVSPTGEKLFTLHPSVNILPDQIEALETGNCTAMGAGLQMGFNTLDSLSTDSQKRVVFLITDGMQNIEPKVTQVGDHYEIIDSGGWLCSNVHSTIPANPGVDIKSYNTSIYPIGVGITANYVGLLQDIAIETNGVYLGTNDPWNDLDLLYYADLCHCLSGGSPAIVHHNSSNFNPKDCKVIETFQINNSITSFSAIVSWEKKLKGSFTFWLKTPDGTLIDLHRTLKEYNTYALATIYLPPEINGKPIQHTGEWQMIIRGETSGETASYHALVIAEDDNTHLTFTYPQKTYEVGDIVPLRIRLDDKNKTVIQPNNLTLETATPRVSIAQLLAEYKLYNQPIREQFNITPGIKTPNILELKLKALSNDPRYQKHLQPIRKKVSLREGSLDYKIIDNEIIIPILLKKPGLNTFRIDAHFETHCNDPIQRVSVVSINVDPGKADPERSMVNVIPISKKKVKGTLLNVTPRNTMGHLIGPGRGNQFKVYLEKQEVKCKLVDQLNGTYQFELLPQKKLPLKTQKIRITFKDKQVWAGFIKQ